MSWLLDTNVLSERTAARPEPAVMGWLSSRAPDTLFISAMSLGELRYGVEKLEAGSKRRRLAEYLHEMERGGRGRVLFVDATVAVRWGAIKRRAELAKRTMPPIDLVLAATAEVHSLTLVTRNTRDFKGWGGPVLNPWEPQPSAS